MLKTLLKWPRDVRQFAPRIDAKELLASRPDLAETAHWGEVILLEDLIVALHRDGTATWLTHAVKAPHGDQNLAEWDEFMRVYDRRKALVTVRTAKVHLPDGTSRPAQRLLAPLDANQNGIKLRFAPLRPGVIVELELQEESFVPDDCGPASWVNFMLQTVWPCRRRRITLAVAEPFTGRLELHHGGQEPQRSQERGYAVYRWDLHNVPGIEVDAFTPPPRDFAPWLDFTTLPDWSSVARHYRKELALAPAAKAAIQKLASELTAGATTDRERAFAIYRYAARDMRYGRAPSELDIATIRDPKHMLEDLRGDCKDKSSLMVAMLAEVNIPAQIAVLLTAMNGRTPLLPAPRFDHAIVVAKIGGRDVWFDPAAGFFSYGQLPQNDQGVKALVLTGENDELRLVDVPLDTAEQQVVTRRCRGELNAVGDYTLRAEITAAGERAALYRSTLADRNGDHRRRTIEQAVAEERPGAIVSDVDFGAVDDLAHDIEYSYGLYLPKWGRVVQDLLLFRIPWAEPMGTTGPISAAQRDLPLQVPAIQRLVERHEIEVPAGFSGYALPQVVRHECPWASYSLSITCERNKLLCERQMETHGGIVPRESFGEFKTFWEVCTRADALDVVLVHGEIAHSAGVEPKQ